MKINLNTYTSSFCFLVISISFPFASSCSFVNDKLEENVKIIKVIDGDTYKSKTKTYRLLGIDTAETFDKNNNFNSTSGKKFFYGNWAKKEMVKLIENKKVNILNIKKDKYNRNVSRITFNNIDISSFLVKNGLAIVRFINTNKKSPFFYHDKFYVENLWNLQNNAIKNKNGFWVETKENLESIFPGYQFKIHQLKNHCFHS